MKKFAFLSAGAMVLLSVSSFALAADTDICVNGTPTVPGNGTAGTHFMMRPIAPKCSANVILKGTDGTGGAWYAMGSVSVKGKTSFKANTNGGVVARHADCSTPGSCTDGEAGNARTQANTDASSS